MLELFALKLVGIGHSIPCAWGFIIGPSLIAKGNSWSGSGLVIIRSTTDFSEKGGDENGDEEKFCENRATK